MHRLARFVAVAIAVGGAVGCSDSGSDNRVQRVAFAEAVASPLSGNVNGTEVQANFQLLADLDGDRRGDVVIFSYESAPGTAKSVDTYLANADGTFRHAGRSPATSIRAVADLNADGKPDYFACGSQLQVLLGSGDGLQATPAGAIPSTTCTFVVADFDGDGRLDVVADMDGPSGARRLELWAGSGGGQFALRSAIPVEGVPPAAFLYLKAGDFDGDGRADLVVGLSTFENGIPQPQRFRVLASSASGAFRATWPAAGQDPFPGDSVFDVLVGDLDRDGRADLFVTTWKYVYFPPGVPGSLEPRPFSHYALMGQADGSLAAPRRIDNVQSPPLALADFDGDGILDLPQWRYAERLGTLDIAFGRGDGSFRDPANVLSTVVEAPNVVRVGDIDGDSRPDLLLVTSSRLLSFLSR